MELSPKAVRIVIEALDHYVQYHEERLQQVDLSDDDRSDLENDKQFLEVIRSDLRDQSNQLDDLRAKVAPFGATEFWRQNGVTPCPVGPRQGVFRMG